ncbi:aldehyde dehydrogenase family protein [Pseudonocardia sp. McavD-2-B]|uniref:aldehyde dehydrogenase family protein n=1 Tax=Pseudonocardia sp. McavD-2-B TaxID=2954499 RepID=UPI002096C591|nr:aldehyde dehydrogenase family protein [Pseudonocardia sp. McavD-2-B]MCO7192545.1 aldehyde dehydrogenase family protein [Pseudonocardia sp. McavD-2-B]
MSTTTLTGSAGAPGAGAPDATAADVERAVAAAVEAGRRWAATPAPERRDVLRRAAHGLQARREELVGLVTAETGSIRAKAEAEVADSIEELHAAAALALHPTAQVLPSAVPGRSNVVERVPVGVVGVITGWNFPMHLALRIAAPALALGNAVLVKPAPETPLSGGAGWADALTAAGLPDGLLGVLPGRAAGPALVGHANVDLIHFTGSTAVGREIARIAGGALKRVALELGGNNPAVVLADADLERTVPLTAGGTFVHQGQVCIATGRHIVVADVAEDYLARLAEHARGLRVGDPAIDPTVDLGPLISERQAERAQRLVADTVAQGAELLTGGTREGRYFPATVVAGVRPGMPLFEEETFAPVVAVTVAADTDEAVALANATEYGLSASVFTRDLERGRAVASRLRAGMVHVNDMTALNETHVPFGGVGASGVGQRFGGAANVELLTEQRWVSVRRL